MLAELGDLIPEKGGLRKIRCGDARRGKGKRGDGAIYNLYASRSLIYLLVMYSKSDRDDLSAAEKRGCATRESRVQMKKQLFDELVESIKEAGQIHRGEIQPSREFVFDARSWWLRRKPDVVAMTLRNRGVATVEHTHRATKISRQCRTVDGVRDRFTKLGGLMSTTGEKPGKGTYTCTNCGQTVVLDDSTDTLPPCPSCSKTNFKP